MYSKYVHKFDEILRFSFYLCSNLKPENISFINKISNIFVNNTKFYTDISN